MLGAFDQGELDIVALQKIDERERVAPRHVGIAHALNDPHRTARIEGRTLQKMMSPLLDETARDRVGLAIG